MKSMEYHEAANIFPLDEEHIEQLANDIRENGLVVPIETMDGKIIDGRRRWLACQKAEVTPETIEVSPADPVAYVLSLNLHRRHLTPSQASMCADRAREFYDRQAKERQKRKPSNSVQVNLPEQAGQSRDAVGKAFGVSGSLVDHARKVRRDGVPELAKAVEAGQISVSTAAKVTELPKDQQKKIAAESKFSGGRYRTPSIPKAKTKPKPKRKAIAEVDISDFTALIEHIGNLNQRIAQCRTWTSIAFQLGDSERWELSDKIEGLGRSLVSLAEQLRKSNRRATANPAVTGAARRTS